MEITNRIDLRGDQAGNQTRMIRLFDNPFSENDMAVLSGVIQNVLGPADLVVRGAGHLAMTNQNVWAGNLILQGMEGSVVLDIADWGNLGQASNGLSLQNAVLNIATGIGNSSRTGSLAGNVTVNIGRFSGLTLNGAANPGIGQTLTKTGLGIWPSAACRSAATSISRRAR